jgi:hypothetical protein
VLHCLLTLGAQSLPTIVSENTTNEVNETSTMTKANGNEMAMNTLKKKMK